MGRPPINPKDLLKLYIYGMDNGIQSSRKLDRECKRNIEAMWLLNGLQPDDKTICNFRRENAEHLARFFSEFSRTLAEAGYIDGKIVAIDGTKIRANNSKRNNFSAKKLERHIAYIDGKIAEYMQELDINDRHEDTRAHKVTEDRITDLRARKVKYEGFMERIERGDVTEVSTTDPDSRLMKQGNNGVDVSFNVQAAVDSKHKLIAGILVTNALNDQGQLAKVAKAVKKNCGLKKMITPADKGYYDTDDIKECHEAEITTIVAKSKDKEPAEGIDFKKTDFQYDKENDCYHCPTGQILKFFTEDKSGIRRYQTTKVCKNCPHKTRCTESTRRVITRHKFAEHAEQNDLDFKEKYAIYKLRQLLCEHPFGTIKRTMNIRQFLTRGLRGTTAEAALIFLCYNFKRLRTICHQKGGKDADSVLLFQLFIAFAIISTFFTPTMKN